MISGADVPWGNVRCLVVTYPGAASSPTRAMTASRTNMNGAEPCQQCDVHYASTRRPPLSPARPSSAPLAFHDVENPPALHLSVSLAAQSSLCRTEPPADSCQCRNHWTIGALGGFKGGGARGPCPPPRTWPQQAPGEDVWRLWNTIKTKPEVHNVSLCRRRRTESRL